MHISYTGIKECSSSERVWIGRIVYNEVQEKAIEYSEELTRIDMMNIP